MRASSSRSRRGSAWILGPALGLALTAPAPSAEATLVKALSLREKVEVSPVIVHGRVERVESDWEVPGAKIRTSITLEVIESLKGGHEPGERMILYRGGGRVGEVTQTAPGLSEYGPGEEVVLFLEPLGAELVAIGIGIGKYAVRGEGDARWVTHAPNVSGVTFREGAPPVVEPILPMSPQPLAAFLKTLRSYVRKIPTAPVAKPQKGATRKPPPALPALEPR